MKILLLVLCLMMLCGCTPSEDSEPSAPSGTISLAEESSETPTRAPTEPPDAIRRLISQMSLEERVGQLFLARCDAAVALMDIEDYHLGGFFLFAADVENETPDSLREKIASYQAAANTPLLIAVDEEGGTVNRVSKFRTFREQPFPAPRTLFESQGYQAVLDTEAEKCRFLTDFGFNVNLGPVCDLTEPFW